MSGQKLSRYYRTPPFVVSKTVTFTGAAGAGEVDSEIPLFTVTGYVDVVFAYNPVIEEALVCSAPTQVDFQYGITGDADFFGSLTDNDGAFDFTGSTGILAIQGSTIGSAVSVLNEWKQVLNANIIFTPADIGSGANITAGEMTFYLPYRPLSPGASVQPA